MWEARLFESTEKLKLSGQLLVNLEFAQYNEYVCFELSRIEGDYLSFMDFYLIMN